MNRDRWIVCSRLTQTLYIAYYDSYSEKLIINNNYINKGVRLFTHQTMCISKIMYSQEKFIRALWEEHFIINLLSFILCDGVRVHTE